jgi:hypothetical protein
LQDPLRCVFAEEAEAHFHGLGRDIDSRIALISRQLKLRAVPAAEFNHRSNLMLIHKCVQEVRFELRKRLSLPAPELPPVL